MKKEKSESFEIGRDDFINFLATSTPEEINKFIKEKGKPKKLIEPMIFFNKDNK